MKKLTDQELATVQVGEAITLASVMAIVSIAISAVVIYKLFTNKTGGVTLPGGYKFEWK